MKFIKMKPFPQYLLLPAASLLELQLDAGPVHDVVVAHGHGVLDRGTVRFIDLIFLKEEMVTKIN